MKMRKHEVSSTPATRGSASVPWSVIGASLLRCPPAIGRRANVAHCRSFGALCASVRDGRRYAELPQEAELIPDSPDFRDLPAGIETLDRHELPGDTLAGRR